MYLAETPEPCQHSLYVVVAGFGCYHRFLQREWTAGTGHNNPLSFNFDVGRIVLRDFTLWLLDLLVFLLHQMVVLLIH